MADVEDEVAAYHRWLGAVSSNSFLDPDGKHLARSLSLGRLEGRGQGAGRRGGAEYQVPDNRQVKLILKWRQVANAEAQLQRMRRIYLMRIQEFSDRSPTKILSIAVIHVTTSQVEGSGKGSERFQAELCKVQQLCEVLWPRSKNVSGMFIIKFIREKQGKVRDGQRRAEQEMVAQEVAMKELEEKTKWSQMILEVRLHNVMLHPGNYNSRLS